MLGDVMGRVETFMNALTHVSSTWDGCGRCESMNGFGTFGDVFGRLGTCGEVMGRCGTFGDVKGHVGTSWDVCGRPGTFGDVTGRFGTSWDVWDILRTSWDVWGRFGTSRDVMGCVGTFAGERKAGDATETDVMARFGMFGGV